VVRSVFPNKTIGKTERTTLFYGKKTIGLAQNLKMKNILQYFLFITK
jgi:hypothetical protein